MAGAGLGGSSRVAAVAAAVGLVIALSLGAVEAAPKPLIGGAGGGVPPGAAARRAVARERRAPVDPSAIADGAAPWGAESIRLNLFSDADFTAERTRFERRSSRSFTWYGKVPDDPKSMVILVSREGLVAGSIFARGKHYRIAGGDAASLQVVEVNQADFPPEGCDLVAGGGALRDDLQSAATADSGGVIDVMVVYTPAARNLWGGTAAIESLITLVVAETNTSYGNSGVSPRLNLVHTAEVAYTETGNWELDLSRLQGTADGYVDDVHTLRDSYRADVVAMLIDDQRFCGLASAILASAQTAFCLVAVDCASAYYTFGHEIGHLQGARHDWYVDPTNNSPFTYNHGDIDLDIRQRTIMSYDDQCIATGASCTRVPYFSNPSVNYPATTRPAGSSIENNTLALNTTATTVANFALMPTLTVASTYPAAGVAITVTPTDDAGLGNGTTLFTRTYPLGTAVTLTAPTVADGNAFAAWSGCTTTSGASGEVCAVTVDANRTVTANYTRDPATRPTAFALMARSDEGKAALWEVDAASGALQNYVWLYSTGGVGSPWLATSFTRVSASVGYVLWTRSDTGQGVLWKVNPATGALTSRVALYAEAGVGSPWQATSYVHVDDATGYVLWTRSDVGLGVLWRVNPASGAVTGSVVLDSATGVGSPWQATAFSLVDASSGVVLWTRTDTGQAVLWRVDPATGRVTGSVQLTTAGYPWKATGYEQTGTNTGYVLWSRSDNGQAVVWQVDPTLPAGPGQVTASWSLSTGSPAGYPSALVGSPWQGVSYLPANNAPTIDPITDVTVAEDAGPTPVALTGIGAGAGESQTVTLTAASSNTALIPTPTLTYASPAATGTLTFAPAANASGSATITVWVGDGQPANSPVAQTFTVTVTPVNEAPTDISLSSNVVDGGLGAGTTVGTLKAADPDGGDTFTYTLVAGAGDTDNASFAIFGSELRTADVLDYAVTNPYSIRVMATDAGGLSTEKAFTVVPPAYALWSRSDTGQARLWRIDPASGALLGAVWLYASSGVGSPWQATSYAHVDGTTGYVLWTRSDTGQARLWRVNPSTGALLGAVWLYSSSGVGSPWQATSYAHIDDATGYVLWTRSDTGQGVLWTVNPATGALTSRVALYSESGVGGPWQAASYSHVDAATGYVLWTRSDTGHGVLWRINPATGALTSAGVTLYAASGVGGPWQATSYEAVSDTLGYVLWSRNDTGQGVLWTVDPTLPTGPGQVLGSTSLYSPAGVGSPWIATSVDNH